MKMNEKANGTPSNGTYRVDTIPTDDLLDVYLAEMSQEPLLTFEEELALGSQIQQGRRAKNALKNHHHSLPSGESNRLRHQIRAGQAARERLSRANTRLVVSIAKRYRGYGVPFSDLIQDGNVGLMRAVDKYDPHTGNRFSTYATWWIRQAVTRSLSNNSRMIRIPVHRGTRIRRVLDASQRLEMENGRRPTVEEIATELDETPEGVSQMIRWSAQQPISLEEPVGREGDAELVDFLEDENAHHPEALTDQNLLSQTLSELLDFLSANEARILRLRYGLDDGQTHTLQQVAERFGLSRERIRQIEKEALVKLRLLAPDFRLRQFLNTE
jgi:RNA polymerase primary sigma factor